MQGGEHPVTRNELASVVALMFFAIFAAGSQVASIVGFIALVGCAWILFFK